MQTVKPKTYSLEQLACADLALKTLTALPEDKQRTAAMMANVFLEGWMARELFSPTPPAAQQPRPGPRNLL